MNWYAIYTKTKREDMVTRSLHQAGIEVYNPKLKARKYLRRQYRNVIEPLFPSYIFARFDPASSLWMIRYTRGVKKVVSSNNTPWPVTREMIDLIRSREDENGIINLNYDMYEKGDTVKIANGPFAGLTGIFERPMKGNERVVLLLNAVTYQARVVVERASLMKAS
jgi:transcriptional antiterminator RfaH